MVEATTHPTGPSATQADEPESDPPGLRLCVVAGTRPEAIKLAPLLHAAAEAPDVAATLISTGQHQDMTRELFDQFRLTIDLDLEIARDGQTPNDIAARTISTLGPRLSDLACDALVVQGDTTSAMAAAIAAFNDRIPVVHVEAGLRSGSLAAPFPEEANRRLIGTIASLHLAPTPLARANLLASGVADDDIVVTGNTVIDALMWMIHETAGHESGSPTTGSSTTGSPTTGDAGRRTVLVTVHRRESWGAPLRRIADALAEICRDWPDVDLVLPLHPNPVVRDPLRERLADLPNAHLTEPLSYRDLCATLARASLVITDSGGIQEEGAAIGVPVIVMRTTTERTEAIDRGTAELVGTDKDLIVKRADEALRAAGAAVEASAPSIRPNPFGDGHAAARSIAAIRWRFGGSGERPTPFSPPT